MHITYAYYAIEIVILRQGGYVFSSVCLFVYLLVGLSISKTRPTQRETSNLGTDWPLASAIPQTLIIRMNFNDILEKI